MSSFIVTLFDTEFMSPSYIKLCIKRAYIMYYSKKIAPSLFWGKLGIATLLFVKINISKFNAFPLFTFKYRPVYMTEATLNANNYIDICLIPSKFYICMYERMKNIYAQNQSSIHCPCVWKAVHNRTF